MLVLPQFSLFLPRGSVLCTVNGKNIALALTVEKETYGTVKGLIIIMSLWFLLRTRVSANKETSLTRAVLLDVRNQAAGFTMMLHLFKMSFWCCWLITPAFSGQKCKTHRVVCSASYIIVCVWQTSFGRSNNNQKCQAYRCRSSFSSWYEITKPKLMEHILCDTLCHLEEMR